MFRVSGGAGAIQFSRELVADDKLLVGRGKDTDFPVQEIEVSKVHAAITVRDGAVWVRDLQSGNGTYLDGRRIESSQWAPGAVLQVGTAQFYLENLSPNYSGSGAQSRPPQPGPDQFTHTHYQKAGFTDSSLSTENATTGDETRLFQEIPVIGPLVAYFPGLRNTRKRILAGENLVDLSRQDRKRLRVLSPIRMCFQFALWVSIPALVITYTALFLFKKAGFIGEGSILKVQMENLIQYSTVVQVLMPFLLVLYAFVAGYSSLWSDDLNKKSRKRATNAYLYIFSSYSLIPHFLLQTTSYVFIMLGITVWKLDNSVALFVYLFIIPFILLLVIWNGVVTLKQVPAALFAANGYFSSKSRFNQTNRRKGPWLKYILCLILTYIVISFLTEACHMLVRELFFLVFSVTQLRVFESPFPDWRSTHRFLCPVLPTAQIAAATATLFQNGISLPIADPQGPTHFQVP